MTDRDTLHRESDAAMRQTFLEYQAILDNASLGVVFTRERTFLRCNDRFSEMFGWEKVKLIGQSTEVVYPSQEAYEALGRAASPVLQTGARFETELQGKKFDGTLFWCRIIAKAIDYADHSKGTIFLAEDITERKQADEAQKQLLLEYQSILDNASLGITFTRDRKFLHCNARFSELFGWPSNELVGQSTHIVYPTPQAYEELGRIAAPVLRNGARLDTEIVVRKRDGSTFWCRMMAKSIDAADNSKGTVFIVEDITERKRAQEALIGARDELEQRVRERTSELATANALLQAEIQERRLAEERIQHLAHHDVLTGLPNRRLLEDRIGQAILAARRNQSQLALLFIDLDHFKAVNDNLGHRMGDQLLQEVATRLLALLRSVDTVSRIGGDEFIVLLRDTASVEAACEAAARIMAELDQPYRLGGQTVTVTPSIGISLFPSDGADVDALLAHADAAMYHAKKMGRKNFQFYAATVEPSGTGKAVRVVADTGNA